jgi:hypothetical protein
VGRAVKILLDHCLPRRFKSSLPAHEVVTAAELGWDTLRNGKLLASAAGAGFHVVLTIDKNIRHQQNLATLPIAVVVILSPTNRFADVVQFCPAVEEALKTLAPCTVVEVALGSP